MLLDLPVVDPPPLLVVCLRSTDTALPVTIWDVSDLQNPVFKGNLSVNAWNKTIPHNGAAADGVGCDLVGGGGCKRCW